MEANTTNKKMNLKHEFKIPKLKKDGSMLKNEAGDIIYDIYVYSFNEMGFNRKIAAEQLFSMSAKMLINAPSTVDQLQVILNNALFTRAFSAILMKKIGDDYETYHPQKVELSDRQLDYLGREEEEYKKLLECRDDFFYRTGLQSPLLTMQSNDIMAQLLDLMKVSNELTEANGVQGLEGMKDIMKLIMETALSSTAQEPEKK
ncbi:MAG: hypothetical protein M0P35_00535 [Bacteroidales bacterium]|jgi:hypothetical protein|nr:hypothetical protein [Bacteroidales bacterium]